jgi:hypothetical protein
MQGRADDRGRGAGWSALRIGPGGVPAEQVRPTGPVDARFPATRPQAGGPGPSASTPPPPAPSAAPHAVLGAFDDATPRRRSVIGVLVLAVLAVAVVGAALWSTGSPGTSSSTDLSQGDCLASSGGQTVIGLDCTAPDAEFVIAARFDNTTDDSRCFTASSDVVLVTRENVVLCLNYLARIGDCLYAGATDDVGKAPCRTSSGSTPQGLFRVIAVLTDTVSARGCQPGTLETLVHRDIPEVVCLGLP